MLIEKYVTAPRHIEMQVFADRHGNAIHLNERDCSLQRRHQKVIEEAPAPGMSAALRAKMGEAAVAAAKAAGYEGAGTIEFIADGAGGLREDGFWFMEMNTRLQVEHPVTEAVTGLDLVEWQFRIAAGETLPLTQGEVPLAGHAVEARLYAEDPARGFLPSTGRLLALQFPQGEGLRIDTGVEAGSEVTPFYDPMIAKLIAHGKNRNEALDRLAVALDKTVVVGPRSNAGFLAALCRAPEFRAGQLRHRLHRPPSRRTRRRRRKASTAPPPRLGAQEAGRARTRPHRERLRARARSSRPRPGTRAMPSSSPAPAAWRCRCWPRARACVAQVTYGAAGPTVAIDGAAPAADAVAVAAGEAVYVLRHGRQTKVALRDLSLDEAGDQGAGGLVRAPMHGKVLAVFVARANT